MSTPMFNNVGRYTGEKNGNVRLYISDSRLIYRLYDFDIVTNRPAAERSPNSHKTTEGKRKINLHNKKIALLGYGLCNPWQYFFTGTIDPKKYAASNFDVVSKLISGAFREMRRKSKDVQYCFILEKHQNGNFHAHGFCNVPDYMINPFSQYVQDDGYIVKASKSKFLQLSIKQCYYKLGLNVISPINDKNSVADYCAKYILKDIASGDSFSKSIFKSHNLRSFEIEYGHYMGSDWECFPGIIHDQYPIEDLAVSPFHQVGAGVFELSIDLK